jgi:uncharacterized membrane protein
VTACAGETECVNDSPAGLILFLGPHLARVLWPEQRARWLSQWGEKGWKLRYTLVSLLGFVLIIWGFGQARASGVYLWFPPAGLKHANSLFTLIAMVLLAAAYVPRNHIKAALKHPMTLAVKVWAFGHLLAVGSLAGVVLFGSFLVWSILVFRAARQRDRAEGTRFAPGTWTGTLASLVVGAGIWALFAFWAHGALIGIRLFA